MYSCICNYTFVIMNVQFSTFKMYKLVHNTFSQDYPKKFPVHYIQAYIYQFMQFLGFEPMTFASLFPLFEKCIFSLTPGKRPRIKLKTPEGILRHCYSIFQISCTDILGSYLLTEHIISSKDNYKRKNAETTKEIHPWKHC